MTASDIKPVWPDFIAPHESWLRGGIGLSDRRVHRMGLVVGVRPPGMEKF